jgi:hypothetical protein
MQRQRILKGFRGGPRVTGHPLKRDTFLFITMRIKTTIAHLISMLYNSFKYKTNAKAFFYDN